jgi:hypothetical protein
MSTSSLLGRPMSWPCKSVTRAGGSTAPTVRWVGTERGCRGAGGGIFDDAADWERVARVVGQWNGTRDEIDRGEVPFEHVGLEALAPRIDRSDLLRGQRTRIPTRSVLTR